MKAAARRILGCSSAKSAQDPHAADSSRCTKNPSCSGAT